jgi:hypothetical protein
MINENYSHISPLFGRDCFWNRFFKKILAQISGTDMDMWLGMKITRFISTHNTSKEFIVPKNSGMGFVNKLLFRVLRISGEFCGNCFFWFSLTIVVTSEDR